MSDLAEQLAKRKEQLTQINPHPMHAALEDADYYLTKLIGMDNNNRYICEVHSVQEKRVLLVATTRLHINENAEATELAFVRMVEDDPWFIGMWQAITYKDGEHSAFLTDRLYFDEDDEEKWDPAFKDVNNHIRYMKPETQRAVLNYIKDVDGD
jgi:hypothetical protein